MLLFYSHSPLWQLPARTIKRFVLALLFMAAHPILSAQFGPAARISPDANDFVDPIKIIPADMDADGDTDLVSVAIFNGKFVWYENMDGQGNLSGPREIGDTGSFGTDDVAVADLDNSGTPDVIGMHDEFVYWFPNKISNTANFPEIEVLSTLPGSGRQLLIRDLDDDGRPDILVAGTLLQIGWYRNLGSGNFADYELLSDQGRYVLDMADMDANGDLDMITASYDSGNGDWILVWLENQNGGTEFGSPVTISDTNIELPREIRAVDMDGDDDLDVLFTDFSAGTQSFSLTWYENTDGLGSFTEEHIIENQQDGSPTVVLDYDSDGDPDICLALEGQLSVLLNDGIGNFTLLGSYGQALYRPDDVGAADLNGDAIPDLISVIRYPEIHIDQGLLQLSQSPGVYGNPIEFVADADRLESYEGALTSSDLNGDGTPEVICSPYNYPRIGWYEFDNSAKKFRNPKLAETYGQALFLDSGDVDGDGDNDLVAVLDYNYDQWIAWYENLDGQGNFGPRQLIEESDYGFTTIHLADLDSDGDLDIFFVKPFGLLHKGLRWLENEDGQGTFSGIQNLNLGASANDIEIVVADDPDLDGDTDLLTYLSSDDGIFWAQNTGGTLSNWVQLISVTDVEQLYTADLNADGAADLIYTQNDLIVLRPNEGDGSFGPSTNIGSTLGFLNYSISFFDGNDDGFEDLYLLQPDGTFYMYENAGVAGGFPAPTEIVNLPEGTVNITIGDYDADGDPDIVGHRFAEQSLVFLENYINTPKINGRVYLDANENSELDPGEVTLFGQTITVDPAALTSFPSANGNFYFPVASGAYEVSCSPYTYFTFTTPESVSVEVTDDTDEVEVFFGLYTDSLVAGAFGNMTSAPTRCGFTVPFWIDYQNQSTVPADMSVQLVLDSLVTYVSAFPEPNLIAGDTLSWTIEEVPPTWFGQIELILEIAGVDFLGEWISIPVVTIAETFDGTSQDTFYYGYRSQINCAYDPNDKLVEPNIPGAPNYTLFGDTLDYTIRFQNTGTDTAFTVVLEDYLDSDLDWSTLQITGSSHAHTVNLDQQSGRLVFTFNDILLPDSTTNEPGSHGYVRFRLLHLDGLPENTYIKNTAGIYFDFNPPIITNTVENILVSEYPFLLSVFPPTCAGSDNGSIGVPVDNPLYESFLWSTGDTTAMIDNLEAGTYSLTVQLLNGVQIDTAITLEDPVPLDFLAPAVQPVSCFGTNDGALLFTAIGGIPGYSYQWSDGHTGQLHQDLGAGLYTVTVTDLNGCTAVASYELTEPSPLDISPDLMDVSCFGGADGQINLAVSGATPPYSYSWSNGSTEPNPEMLPAGTYNVTVSDVNDCTSELSVSIGEPNEILIAAETMPETGQNADGSIMLTVEGGTPPYTFAWDYDPNQTNSVLSNLSAGEYTVTVTDASDCEQSLMITVGNLTSVTDFSENPYLYIFPNPSEGHFWMQVKPGASIDAIRLMDNTGKIVRAWNMEDFATTQIVEVADLPVGMYQLSAYLAGQVLFTRTVVVQ